MPAKKRTKTFYCKKYLFVTFGAFLAAIGLELFLVPNQVIDGGIVGISIMLDATTSMSFSALLLLLNLPFFLIGIRSMGWRFTITGIIAISLLSLFSALLSTYPPVTNDSFLAAIFGGLIDGLGVGIIIRFGGFLDGSDVVAVIADRKSVFSVGEVEMFLNLFILSAAGLVFGWDKAMYSLFAYYIISKSIDVAVKGLNESYVVMIVTDEHEAISQALMKQMNRGVTLLHGEGGYTGNAKKILYTTMTRLEVGEMKELVKDIDENAFITLSVANDIVGGRFHKC